MTGYIDPELTADLSRRADADPVAQGAGANRAIPRKLTAPGASLRPAPVTRDFLNAKELGIFSIQVSRENELNCRPVLTAVSLVIISTRATVHAEPDCLVKIPGSR